MDAQGNLDSQKEQSGLIEIVIDKGSGAEITVPVTVQETLGIDRIFNQNYVILITKKTFGDGAGELGKRLLKDYLYTLLESSNLPTSLLFVNSGVFLTTQGSKIITLIKWNRRVWEFSCGTCLDYYNLKDRLKVGPDKHGDIVEKTTKTRTISL